MVNVQSFKDLVAACLVKDPKKRPSSEKLMKHPFFKHARPTDYLQRTILEGLPPLGDRFRTLKVFQLYHAMPYVVLFLLLLSFCSSLTILWFQAKEAELLLQNNDFNGNKEQLSQVKQPTSILFSMNMLVQASVCYI